MKTAPAFRTRSVVILLGGLLIAGLIAANAHLVYVAVTSQPDCVTHIKRDPAAKSTGFSAAGSAC
jgi:hypothetical protein